mgnify:CR=1 FL=1
MFVCVLVCVLPYEVWCSLTSLVLYSGSTRLAAVYGQQSTASHNHWARTR